MRRLALPLLALAVLACGDDGAPRAAGGPPLAVDVPEFGAQEAYALLERQVAFGPRAPGSSGHAAQLAWMEEYLRERADTVVLQPFRYALPDGDTLSLTNVFARFRPDAADRILLVAHWDTRPTADEDPDPERRDEPILGANDGASGTAVLLRLADLMAREAPPIGVDLLLVDGEDWAQDHMYLGATHFAANLPPGYAPLYGVLVDMVADRQPVFPIEGYSQQLAPEVVDRVWSMAERVGHGARFPRRVGMAIEDDHIPLNRAGIRTIDIIDFDYPAWHTTRDVLDSTSPTGLEAVGEVLAALIYSGG